MPTSAPTQNDDLYRRLQQHLDRMPVPYPATESGVELRILQRLFSPEEARLALCLSMIPERVTVIRREWGVRSLRGWAVSRAISPVTSPLDTAFQPSGVSASSKARLRMSSA